MMITVITTLSLLASAAHGFSASIQNRRPDATKAVEEALKITASFGIESKEAKVAWDIVEEMDASDNSEAMKGGLDVECDVTTGEISAECVEYAKFMDELFILRDAMGQKPDNKKTSLVDALKSIKLTAPEAAQAKSSPELTKALEEAKTATEKYGITSAEARLAWETYEDIASAGTQNAYGVNLMEECSVESGLEACKAMEELQRVMPVLLAISKKD